MKLIQQLLNPSLYPHPVHQIQLVETHISWVILTGDFAYKLKKPVDFGFLDFSTLEKRQHYCNEELRLNKRLAPQIYLETVRITGAVEAPRLNGPGPALEYAVKMRQFRQQDQFDRLLAKGRLNKEEIAHLASLIARFHLSAEIAATDSSYGDPDHVFAPVLENVLQMKSRLENAEDSTVLAEIAAWSQHEFQWLRPIMVQRKQQGFIRECHGDMHLRNIAKYHGDIILFDCIEFNDNLRWIDVISEIAFIEMDLHDRERPDFAIVLLNTYLQHTGDYVAMVLLRFYLVYRAMVRAKVDCLRAHQNGISAEEKTATLYEFRRYLHLAHGYTQAPHPFILITCGLSGCGKTYASERLMDYLPFIRIRSDVERKRLFGLRADESSDSAVDAGIYTANASHQTYDRLAQLVRTVAKSQWGVLVDAAFLRAEQRLLFQNIARELHLPFLILHFSAPHSVLRERINLRQLAQRQRDASEADLTVLETQIQHQQPPCSEERSYTLGINTEGEIDFAALAQRIHSRLKISAAGGDLG